MSRVLPGVICGLIFGALAAAMLPLKFPDKRAALPDFGAAGD